MLVLNSQFYALLELTPTGVIQSDCSGACIYANRKWLETTGATLEKTLGHGWLECVHADDLSKVMETWTNASSSLGGRAMEFRVRRPSGEIRFLKVTTSAFGSEMDGNAGLIGFVEDVTDTRCMAILLDISDRVALESTVFASTELQRAIIDNAAYAIIATTPDGTITRFNSAAERLLGYSANELIHKHTPSVFHIEAEVVARAREFGAELGVDLKPGFDVFVVKSLLDIPNEHEWTYVRKDGSHVSVMLGISVLRDESRMVTGFVGIAKDISRSKAAEEALRVTKERLDLAVRGSFDGLWDWNLETAEVYFSPRLHEMLGFSKNEARISRPDSFMNLIHPEDKTSYKEAVDAHLEKNKSLETITRIRTKHGEWRWLRIRGDSVKDCNGAPTRMAGSMSDITPQKTAEEKLALIAVTDQLTGLFNRAGFFERMSGVISRAAKYDSKFAVMYLDFDRFKAINDNWGHEIGDELLRQIADRLRHGIFAKPLSDAKASTIARLGGDEFVVLVEKLESPEEATKIVQGLQEILSQPYLLGKHHTCSTASIGIVVGPASYHRAEDILHDADTAMYEAKQAGRARYIVFDSEMRRRARRRIQLERDLSDAIGTSQLELQYQPVVSLLTGEINSVEVSLRWQNPKYGTVEPSEFMPIAQSSDLILRLSEWVLKESCQQCQFWHRTMERAAAPQVSVNLPHKQFTNPGLLDLLRRILAETGLTPSRLMLEISQECFTVDAEQAIHTMTAIKSLGIELAIDNFGVGTASFVTLHQFPVSVLKLDRSLIGKIENSKCEAALLHGLVVMARNLNVKLVAEGVELRCQQKAVLELGCEFMQGSFAANPMPVVELENFLSFNPFGESVAIGAMAFASGWSERMTFIEPPSQ